MRSDLVLLLRRSVPEEPVPYLLRRLHSVLLIGCGSLFINNLPFRPSRSEHFGQVVEKARHNPASPTTLSCSPNETWCTV